MAHQERTFAIIKPDAVGKGVTGQILARIEESGLRIIAMKRIQLSEQLAQGFYAVHKERPFFGDLVEFMTSGPVVALVLEGEGAIKRWRDLMGPTNSNDAPAGTIRGDYGTDVVASFALTNQGEEDDIDVEVFPRYAGRGEE